MKGVINLFAMMTVVALMISSCTMQDGDKKLTESTTLELSMYSLVLPNSAEEATTFIKVTTNQETVKVQSLAPEWLKAEYRDNIIYVSALSNQSGVNRKTNLLVFAGSEFEVIEVQQRGATLFLELSQTEILAPADGETVLIDVQSNGDKWKFEIDEPAEEWLSVARINKFLQITIAPNFISDQRVGHIYVEVNGAAPTEITITQQAFNNGARFGLPLLEKKPTTHAIIDYEKKQGSYVVKYEDSSLGEPLEKPYIVFLYASPVFKSVTYYIVGATSLIDRIEMLSNDAKTLVSDEFIQTLIDKGFEIDKKKGFYSYSGESKELGFKVEVDINELKESKITFVPL